MDGEKLLRELLDALARSVDEAVLRQALAKRFHLSAEASSPRSSADASASAPAAPPNDLLGKLVLADILDDSILSARPGDKGFPLRMFFSRVGEALSTDAGWALSCGLNFYFRVPMDDETKMRFGLEVSRQFYRFVEDAGLERDAIAQIAPLLATLLTSELQRVRLESVDHAAVFDSQVHEREPGSDTASPQIVRARSFLCRVTSNNMVRAKAMVRT
jgi:hypothetical protein